MRIALTAALAALVLSAGAARAADANNAALTFSPGSCQDYLNLRWEQKPITLFKGWLSGWISAHDRLTPDTYALVVDDEQLVGPLKFMEAWCNANPLRDFVDGAGELVEELYPRRQREAPKETP